MELKIEHEDDVKRGMFFAKEGEKTAGFLSYLWADKNHMVVYFTDTINGFDKLTVENDLFEAAVDYARSKSVKIIPVSSLAKNVLLNDSKKYGDVIELD